MVDFTPPIGISEENYAKFQKKYINLIAKFSNLDNVIPEYREFRSAGNKEHAELNIMCRRKQDLKPSFMEWAYILAERNLKQKYLAFGFRWQKNTSYHDLFLMWARYLIAFESGTYEPVAYVFFRFNVAMGQTAVTIYGIHVTEKYRNLGLGTHLMRTLEVLAHRLGVALLIIGVARKDTDLKRFLHRLGFSEDKNDTSVNSEYQVLIAPTLCYKVMEQYQKSKPLGQ